MGKRTWLRRWEALVVERRKMAFEILKSLNSYEREREGRIKEIAFARANGNINEMAVVKANGIPMPRKAKFTPAEARLLRGISCFEKAMELSAEEVGKFKRDEQRAICSASLICKSDRRGLLVERLP